MTDSLRLDMGTGDADSLSLFDTDTYRGPNVLAPLTLAAPLPQRCPACHGRTDDRSPRCTCDRQPEGTATAQTLGQPAHDGGGYVDSYGNDVDVPATHDPDCPGPIMAPVFGLPGPRSCMACGWSS